MLSQPPWSPDYAALFRWRQAQLIRMAKDPKYAVGALEYYRTRPVEFILHWCDTYDPRMASGDLVADLQSGADFTAPTTQSKSMVRMPMIMWQRQVDLVNFLWSCLAYKSNGLIEKSRDAGATWVCCCFSIWMWLFLPGSDVGWGSHKQDQVDVLGVMSSIFEKIRTLIRGLPPVFLPEGFSQREHLMFMRVVNPVTGSTIIGESGDNIGRGGRTTIYFKDESAHYDHPEAIEAALLANTDVQIDISSVNGLGNVFHRKREAGVEWEPTRPVTRGKTNVLIIDWRDDPRKTREWYEERRSDMEDKGLLHVFRQEVDRNYAASLEGVIIDPDWVEAAIDAHLKIPGMEDGPWSAALDVADEGGDLNALVKRKGVVIKYVNEWGSPDIGVSSRKAIDICGPHATQSSYGIKLYYDCNGVGSTVKAESNRLQRDGDMPKGMHLVPWDAGSSVLFPDENIITGDRNSMLNKDFYHNLKSQGWWQLRLRFERTYKMIKAGRRYPPDQLISIDSKCNKLRTLQKELSQPTMTKSGRLKLLIDKKPKGSRSPNVGDAAMMVFWPPDQGAYDHTLSWVA